MRPLTELTPSVIRQRLIAKCLNAVDRRILPPFQKVIGRICKNGIRAYWWTGERNFGDLITPSLLRLQRITPILCINPGDAQLAGCGSIIGRLPPDYSGIILGAGLLSDSKNVRCPRARIVALRGQLTKQRLGVSGDVLLGDLGLLAVDLASAKAGKRYKLGIVPHYEDYTNPVVLAIATQHPGDVAVINAQSSPRHVIRQIQQCDAILSSSLHGLVVADSLGVPNRWTVLSDRVIGKGFKFHDYYSAFGVEKTPMNVGTSTRLGEVCDAMHPPMLGVGERQDQLRGALQDVCEELVRVFPHSVES